MDDDKMIETAMRTAFIRQHGIELPEWINDHYNPPVEKILATDYDEPITWEDVWHLAIWFLGIWVFLIVVIILLT